MSGIGRIVVASCVAVALLGACGQAPVKRYYTLNYVPEQLNERVRTGPYPFTIRVRELDIEEAYARPQIVYRKSPFQLQYYSYRVWAVKPTRMVTDLIHKHMLASGLVTSVVRRYDEGLRPQYELSGMIEAIEEYDSEEIWFAHLALHLRLTRLSDGKVIYNRRFDHRKRVYETQPEFVVKEMSVIVEHILNQLMHDIDIVLAREYGMAVENVAEPADPDSTLDTPELWK